MVAATEEMLTMLPPLPAAPPGRMARNACFMPSAVPTTFTSSMRRRSAASMSTTSAVISTPALLTSRSKPPRDFTVASTAATQLASSVTSSRTKSAFAPVADSAWAVSRPLSSITSAITTEAPAAASACAMAAPIPRAAPVTRAFRPDKSKAFTSCLLWFLDTCQEVRIQCNLRFGQSSRYFWTTVKNSLDVCQRIP